MATEIEIGNPAIFSQITPVEFAIFAEIGIYDIGPAIALGAHSNAGATNPCFLPPPLEGVIPEIDLLTNVDPGLPWMAPSGKSSPTVSPC